MNEARQAIKKVIKLVLASKLLKIVIVISIIIALIFFVLIPAFIHFITMDDGSYKQGDSSNVPYAVETDYIKNVKFGENGIYFEKEDENGAKTIITAEDIWKDLVKHKSPVADYLNTPEELATLMNAQIVTQFPKLPGLADDKLNGSITFERRTVKEDGTSNDRPLVYISYDDFKAMVDADDMAVLERFTLDDNNNLLIAVKDRATEKVTYNDPEMKLEDYSQTLNDNNKNGDTEYNSVTENITSRTINYQNALSKYVMPFQYLWSFLVISDCEDFVKELADLVNESAITITIFDSITTTETTEINTYKKKRRTDKYVSLSVSPTGVIDKLTERYWLPSDSPNYQGYNATETTDDINYEITHTSTYESNTPNFDVTYANTWIVEVKKEYDSETDINEPTPEVNNLSDTEYKEDEGSPQDSNGNAELLNDGDAVSFKNEYQQELQSAIDTQEAEQNAALAEAAKANNTTAETVAHTEAEVTVSYVKINNYTRKIERTKTTTTKTTTKKYIKKSTNETREKTALDPNEKNFVTILCKAEYVNAKNQIFNCVDWLFELLENNPDTVNMIDLTKYLFNKVLGRDKFDTNFSFSEYANNSFSNVGSLNFSGTIQQKVWFALKALNYTDEQVAGAMGNIDYESAGFSTLAVEGNGEGIGLCQWSFGRKAQLISYASSKGLTWQDEDTQVEFLIAEISGGGPASGAANKQLQSTGNLYGEPSLSTSDSWGNSTTVENATKSFCYTFERPKVSEAHKSMPERIRRAEAYLSEFAGMEAPVGSDEITLTGENAEKMQQLISEAVRIANNDSYTYKYGAAHNGPGGWTSEPKQFDCSSYVGYLYYKTYGIYVGGTSAEIHNNLQGSKVPMTDLKPGDILWKSGHVGLYIGSGQIAEALNERVGIKITTRLNVFSEAYRIVK